MGMMVISASFLWLRGDDNHEHRLLSGSSVLFRPLTELSEHREVGVVTIIQIRKLKLKEAKLLA